MVSYLTNRFFHRTSIVYRSFSSFHFKSEFKVVILKPDLFQTRIRFEQIHSGHPLLTVAGKYVEVSDKLETIPYSSLLEEGWEAVRRDFIYNDDKRLADALNWSTKVLDYTLGKGKRVRASILLKAYYLHAYDMKDNTCVQYDTEEWKAAVVAAWCIEILQAFFLLNDDIMDGSQLRRGVPCWYTLEDVGLCGINDALLLNCGIYVLLKKHIGHLKSYSNILHEFLQVTHRTTYGQCLDMLCKPANRRPMFENFSSELYQSIIEYKTAYYTFCLPINVAMHLVGKSSAEDFNVAKKLCLKLGMYFQSRDDYLDSYGDPKLTGKLGNDIREGKCTWLAVKFLEKASVDMKKEFMENYGMNTENAVAKILELYDTASIKEEFCQFDDSMHREIIGLIEQLDATKGGLFYNIHSILRNRQK